LPIGGSKIRWRPIPVSSYGPGHYDTVSLADGTFELRGLPRGEIQVIALTRDRVEAHSPVLDLRPGESRSLEPLVLTSGGTIRGRVVPNDVKSENVVPHIGGSVVAMFDGVLESASFPLEYFHQCHLGRDGGFELPSLRAGRWKLAWRNADRFGMPPPRWTDDGTLVDVKDGEVHEVTLTPAR
jgi:hypothetical protein